MEVSQILSVGESRKQTAADIDSMVEDLSAPAPSLAASQAATDDTTPDEKVVFDLKTAWPIVKAVFSFIRPFLFFKPKWKIIIDRFIAGIDVIIPE